LAERGSRVAGVVLAAGLSRRFGGPKLLAAFGGRPILSHVLDAVSAARGLGLLAGAHVVAAAGDAAVAQLARDAGATVVANPEPAQGLSGSLRLGLSALPADIQAALILLGDQPLVRLEVIGALVDVWRDGIATVVRPRYAQAPDAPGHPVLLDRGMWHLADHLEGDSGFAVLFPRGAAGVIVLEVPGLNPDVNTPAELLSLEDSP
jgi:molybdenum cofactor cytidylyltransferase